MRRELGFSLALALVVGVASVAQAADTFQQGDVMVSTSSGNFEQWRKVSGTWTKIDTLNGGSGITTGSAFDNSGNFYGTMFSSNQVVKFAGAGTPHTSSTLSNTDSGAHVESILITAGGSMYVGQADGTRDVLKIDMSTGSILDRYDVATGPRGSDWIDLAADGRTLYYTSEGTTIYRYDLVTKTQLSAFTTGLPTGSNAFALRILSDGGVLVADRQSIVRLNSSGSVVQTYDVSGVDSWFALNLDPDGQTFWSSSFATQTGTVYRFNISTGSVVDSFNTGAYYLYGLSVYGETSQSNPTVPLPPAAWLGLALLGGLGVQQRLRRRQST